MVEHLLTKFQRNILFIMQLQGKSNYYWGNDNYNSIYDNYYFIRRIGPEILQFLLPVTFTDFWLVQFNSYF